jgi:hypothetical protein
MLIVQLLIALSVHIVLVTCKQGMSSATIVSLQLTVHYDCNHYYFFSLYSLCQHELSVLTLLCAATVRIHIHTTQSYNVNTLHTAAVPSRVLL